MPAQSWASPDILEGKAALIIVRAGCEAADLSDLWLDGCGHKALARPLTVRGATLLKWKTVPSARACRRHRDQAGFPGILAKR
jgi:hypothetical protein